ncbi:MAG: phosphoribosylglycinamide formyltransferase, partial [Ruminococcaceae bacterium]|nr:phosphoribosylglycinamide formyltransferase [Oscillospiraceae bacterium]
MNTLKKIGVLVSGGGTNLQAILDAEHSGIIKSGKVSVVISSSDKAYALERAAKAGVPAVCVLKKECSSKSEFEEKISKALSEYEVDIIVLAGFMHILSCDFIAKYKNRMINVHPSLIPSFCGDGFYGLKVHEAALAKGVKVT